VRWSTGATSAAPPRCPATTSCASCVRGERRITAPPSRGGKSKATNLLDAFLIQFLTGLSGASSLFLVAAGLTVIFGVTRVVNFSHGSLFMLGAYLAWSILTRLPREPAWHAARVLLAGLASLGIDVVLEMALLRRICRAPDLLYLLATFGVVLVVQDLTLLVLGPNDLPLPRPPWLRGFVHIAGQQFPLYD